MVKQLRRIGRGGVLEGIFPLKLVLECDVGWGKMGKIRKVSRRGRRTPRSVIVWLEELGVPRVEDLNIVAV